LNIFLVFPFEDKRTGIAIKEGFEALGHRVCCVDSKVQFQDVNSIYEEKECEFDVLICSRTIEIYDQIVRIKKNHSKIKTAIWNPDLRIPVENWGLMLHMFSFVDYYFDVSEGIVPKMKEYNKNSYYMPQGIHNGVFKPVYATELQSEKYSCDVSFIGNLVPGIHEDREKMFHILNQKVKFIHVTNAHDSEHNAVVACSSISLCHSVYPEIKNSYSVRNWQILAGGGIGLDLYHEGIEDTFHKGIASYKTEEEVADVACHILKNYETYRKAADRARKIAMQSDLYKHRCAKILRIMCG